MLAVVLAFGLVAGGLGGGTPSAAAQQPPGSSTTGLPPVSTTTTEPPPVSTTSTPLDTTTTSLPVDGTTTTVVAGTTTTSAPLTSTTVKRPPLVTTTLPKGGLPGGEGGGDGAEGGISGSSGSGNTGGGVVEGDNPITKINDVVWETPVLIGDGDGGGALALLDATRKSRVELEKELADVRAFEASRGEAVKGAQSVVDAKKADLARLGGSARGVELDIDRAQDALDAAKAHTRRVIVSTFLWHQTDRDPDSLEMAGELLDADRGRRFSRIAMDTSVSDERAAELGVVAAKARADEVARSVSDAQGAFDVASADLERTVAEAEFAKVAVRNAELNLAAVAFDLFAPDGSLDPTATGSAANSGQDPALAALLAASPVVTFPIAGPWNFIDSWGYPRDGGARRHKGNDIFSPTGTPIVAVEDGQVRVRSNRLGGLCVYLYGSSGNRYYYAHLSGTIDGIDGATVKVGQVLGFVGNSGNAVSTPPHVHFEVQPKGQSTLNPYPMLRTLATAVTTARSQGAGPTVDARELPKLPPLVAAGLWDQGRVRASTVRELDAVTLTSLVTSLALPPLAVAAAEPAVKDAVIAALPPELAARVPGADGLLPTTTTTAPSTTTTSAPAVPPDGGGTTGGAPLSGARNQFN